MLNGSQDRILEEVTILEAAQRLGVSDDTVRRRLRIGQLEGRRERTSRGYRWVVQVPPYGQRPEQDSSLEVQLLREQLADLRQYLALTREELAVRRGEVKELLALLRDTSQSKR